MRVRDLKHLELVPRRDALAIHVAHSDGVSRLEGAEASGALGIAMPRINYYGGTTAAVREGIAIIRSEGGPDQLIASAANRRWTGRKDDSRAVADLPAEVRMALEMALHERQERANVVEELEVLKARLAGSRGAGAAAWAHWRRRHSALYQRTAR